MLETMLFGNPMGCNWCNKLCKLLSNVAHDLEYDNKFGDLVESLQLKGNLLAL